MNIFSHKVIGVITLLPKIVSLKVEIKEQAMFNFMAEDMKTLYFQLLTVPTDGAENFVTNNVP